MLTTPVIRCLKLQTDAEIHFLTKPAFAGVVQGNRYIDKTMLLKDDLSQTVEELRMENYDLIIDLHKNMRSFRIAWSLGKKTIRYNKLNFRKWLFVRFKWDILPRDKHLVDRYFDALQPLGIQDDGMGLDYPITTEDVNKAIQLTNGVKYQVLVLGATYFTKRIPQDKCSDIIASYPGMTVLTGGKDVQKLGEELLHLHPDKVIDSCGKVSLDISAALIKLCHRVVTGDTGLMHIAAALQKEIVVIWGNTVPQFGMYPYYGYNNTSKHTNKEVTGLDCRPCSKLGFDHCPKGHFKCMKAQQL